MATKRKPKKKVAKRRRTTKEPVLTKLDYWAIAANEVYMACRKANIDSQIADQKNPKIVTLPLPWSENNEA